MRAIAHTAFGPPADVLSLREVARPVVPADGLLVRVEAVPLTRGDRLTTEGLPYIARPMYGWRTPRRAVAGQAFAGRVVEVGAGASGFAPGDAVFGLADGTLAEFAAVAADRAAHTPDAISSAQAAAAPISGVTALQAVRGAGGVSAGQRLLVIGASGGVGGFAVQIGKALGAHVTGVAGPRSADAVRALGADDVIDYSREDLLARGGGYDVIVDLAGNRPVAVLRRAVVRGGTIVLVGGTGGRTTMGFGRTIGAMLRSPFVPERLVGLITDASSGDLETLAALMADGRVTPRVAELVPFADVPTAMARVGEGGVAGTLVACV